MIEFSSLEPTTSPPVPFLPTTLFSLPLLPYPSPLSSISSCPSSFSLCFFSPPQTFTMEGYGADKGVSPRAVAELFSIVDSSKKDISYTLTFSMLEIYNESILDLLDNSPNKVRTSACVHACMCVYMYSVPCVCVLVLVSPIVLQDMSWVFCRIPRFER